MLPGEMVGRIRCVSIASDTNPHAKYKRGAVSRSPLVRLESELLQVFQNSIKQLQCCNNEFEDISRRNVVLVDITQCAHAGLRR